MDSLLNSRLKIITLIMTLFGLIGAGAILIYGERVLGTSDSVPWGSLIAIYLLFAASSVGLTIMASLWYIFRIEVFKVVTKRALTLAIISIVLGFIAIGLELGNPLNMVWLLLSPNLTSGIWWMGTLYVMYLGLRVLTVYNIYLGNDNRVMTFSRLTFFAGIAAVSNLGAVFGNIHARPFWQGSTMSFQFLLIAFMSGAAILAIVTYLLNSRQPGQESNDNEKLLTLIGKILATLIGIFAFLTIWKLIINLYGQVPGKYEAAMALLAGPLSISFWLFEVGIGMVIPMYLLLTTRKFASDRVFKASVLAMIGHYNMVIAGQIFSPVVIEGMTGVPYNFYFPSWPEISILIGTIGGAIFLALWVEENIMRGNGKLPHKIIANFKYE